jgi:hypothetical protein
MNRRQVAVSGTLLAGAVGLAWYWGVGQRTGARLQSLVDGLPADVAVRNEERIGVPDPAVVAGLWHLARLLAARWDLTASLTIREADFVRFVTAKTSEPPGYLTEYEAAVATHRAAGEDVGALFEARFRTSRAETEAFARLHRFVIREFLEWLVANGGFRRFGYVNYRGFSGGPLGDPARPPYRTR